MTTRNSHTLVTSVFVGSGLLLACVDNGHIVGDKVQAGASGEAGSNSSVGAADGSGGSVRQDRGDSGDTAAGGKTGGTGGKTGGTGGTGGKTGGTGGKTGGTGGKTGGTGGKTGGTGGTGETSGGTDGAAAGAGGSTAGGTGGTGGATVCSISGGGNLSIPFEQAEQYACCASDDACHVVYSNCSCAAVSTQVAELVQAFVCDTNTCLEPPGRNPPAAVCEDGQCTLVLDTGNTGGTGGSTTGGAGGTGGAGTGGTTECSISGGGNLSIPFEQAEQYACCASDDACHILYTNCGCAAVSTQVAELVDELLCTVNECTVRDRNPPRAVCDSGKCTRVFDYVCTGTLEEVTAELGTDCPATYGATDAWLKSCEGVSGLPWSDGYSGSCDGFSVVQVSWGTHGQTCYYDGTSGELVGAVVDEDLDIYCEGTASMMAGGEYPTACPFTVLTYRGACNCNDLENVGTDVTPVDTNAAMPAGQGGSFPFGTWVLTDVRTYAGSSVAGALPVMRQTLVTMGGDGLFVGLENGATTHKAFEYTTDGTAITFTTTCTTDDSSPDIPYSSFTSDGLTITLYSSSYGMSVTYTLHSG
jgi:hypothetical protein